jgi:hypothetical protein
VLLELPPPAVPAVDDPVDPALLPVDPAPLAELPLAPGLLVEPAVLPAAPLVELGLLEVELEPPDPIRALVNMYWPPERLADDAAPVVPLVPVAPEALLPPCRHPTTVIARLLPEV